MNSQYMKVNPNELVIDLPVDEAHVAELMESIQRVGLQESPSIWLNGLRIINGFHRVVACQKLGVSEIDCIVRDCDEEAFWDARIIAAKPHVKVSDQRLAVWIIDSWKASPWYKPVDIEQVKLDYERFGGIFRDYASPDAISAAQALWAVNSDGDLKKWFDEKAKKWGVNPWKILESLGFSVLSNFQSNRISPLKKDLLKDVIEDNDLSFTEIHAISNQIKTVQTVAVPEESEIVKRWVSQIKSGATKSRLSDYRKDNNLVEIRRHRLNLLDRKIDGIFDSLEALDIKEFPESLRRLTSLIVSIENKMIDAFPDHMTKSKANPLILENTKLHKQVKEQQREIESLKRALESKQVSEQKFPSTAAIPGVLIEAMQ